MPLTVLLHGDPLAPQQARLGAALDARGHRVVVCDAPGVAAAIRRDHGRRCREVRLLWRGPQLVRRLWARAVVRALGVDVIHVNYVHPRHELWSSMPHAPAIVATAWGSDLNEADFPRTPEYWSAVRRVMSRASAITADSVPLLARAREYAGDRDASVTRPAEIVLWGVDTEAFDPARAQKDAASWRAELRVPEGARVVLSPRQIQPHYRVDRIVRAFAATRARAAGAILVLKQHREAIESEPRASLDALARELGIADSVRWARSCAYGELPGLFAAADVAVSALEADGVPSTFCELSALGVPIVATRLPAYEGVLDDERALLVPPGDHDALVQAIDEAVAAGRGARTEAARAWALDKAAWPRCVDAFVRLYGAALSSRRAAAASPSEERARVAAS